jgi:hypothetical protein
LAAGKAKTDGRPSPSGPLITFAFQHEHALAGALLGGELLRSFPIDPAANNKLIPFDAIERFARTFSLGLAPVSPNLNALLRFGCHDPGTKHQGTTPVIHDDPAVSLDDDLVEDMVSRIDVVASGKPHWFAILFPGHD